MSSLCPHQHPELFTSLKALVDNHHLDAPSLSLAHKVEGGYYDFCNDGYSYSFTLNNTYYITVEAMYDGLHSRINYNLCIIDLLQNRTLLHTTVFKKEIFEDLVVRTIEYKLNTKLFLFG